MSTTYVLRLDDPLATLETAGGKGASLARLSAAGLPVPGGFHVTTAAYRRFVDENAIQPGILAALAGVDLANPDSLEAASTAIRGLFDQGAILADIAAAVASAYAGLDGAAVAVRSSATAEDLPEASFAGQQETFLNIRGEDALLEAVKKCWASLWTARAIAYRIKNNIDQNTVALAVVVQEMVNAEVAGILFTANPINGRRDEMVINAAWGLGEAIVGGLVSPDTIVANKATGKVKQFEVTEKTVITVLTETGTREDPLTDARRNSKVLNEADVVELVDIARRIESYYGKPQDIEWCHVEGKFYIVQSRPITTLFPLPEPIPAAENGLRIYACVNVVFQGIKEPFTPMGWDIFRLLYVGMVDELIGRPSNATPSWIMNAAGRMYLDITSLLVSPRIGTFFANGLAIKDPVATRMILQVMQSYASEIRGGRKIKLPWRFFGKAMPNQGIRAFYGFIVPCAARKKLRAVGETFLASAEQRARQLTSRDDQLHFVEELARKMFWTPMYQAAYCAAGWRSMEIIPALLKKWLGSDALAQPVLQALPYNPTTEMGQSLLRTALILQKEQAPPTPEHPAIQDFMTRFGHRAVREIDIGMPRWREDPTYILEILSTYVAQDNLESRIEQFRTAQLEAESAIPRIVAEVRQRKGWLHARLIVQLLRCLRELGGLREQPKFDMNQCFALLRRVLVKVGQDLVEQGRLNHAEDVFYVSFADIRSDKDLRACAAEARTVYNREVTRSAVPRIMTSRGDSLYTAPTFTSNANTLTGIPVSPGVYEGVAHIIHEPIGAKLERGEILVTHSTDPSWTPLFLNAGAVIMETGGPISHGAIVAREYGIPAVAGVGEASTRLHTGQRLRVNGETGEVSCLN